MATVTKCFGCRHPESKGIGCWDGAFIWAKTSDGRKIGAMFDKTDFIGHPSEKEAKKQYEEFIEKGWKPMTREDINKTAGL